MFIKVTGEEITEQEQQAYIRHATDKYGAALSGVEIKVGKENVEMTYHLNGQPFERIRRITGYLVGSLDRWNNAKQAEEKDRVKHGER